MNLPVGLKFRPTDEVVISYYLMLKVNGFPPPDGMDDIIPSVNFYEHSPEELIAIPKIAESDEWYFFTEMKGSGKRSSRKTKGGFWKAIAKDKPVYDGAGSLIGHKRTLDFYEDKKRTEYKMNEYTITSVKSSNKMKYWVVNKIYQNKQAVGMKRIKDAVEFYCESPISAQRAKKDGDDEVNHIDGQSSADFNLDETDYKIFEDDKVNHSDDQSLAEYLNGLDDITNYKIDEEKDNQVNHFDGQYSLTDNRIDDQNMFDGFVEGYMPSNVFAIHPDDHWQVPQVDPFDNSILEASQQRDNSDFCGSSC